MITIVAGMKSKGLPVFNIATARKNPIAREPASPIRSRLGEALYHKYPKRHTANSSIICFTEPSIPFNEHMPYIVIIEIMDNVPQSPSTPSVQLVTLILAQIKITASITKGTTGIVKPVSVNNNWICVPL